jgi:hypothetical protein
MIPNAYHATSSANFAAVSKLSTKSSASLFGATGTTNAVKAQGSLSRGLPSPHNYALSRDVMLERMEKLKHFFISFLTKALAKSRSWYLRGTLCRSFAAEPTYKMNVPGMLGGINGRWGVVQLVGHLTVNEDGEGSNPSAPANSPN